MFYSATKAKSIASLLQADDDEWTYQAEIQGEFGRVRVLDESGEFIAYWGDAKIDANGMMA